jgi:hypothetical protein
MDRTVIAVASCAGSNDADVTAAKRLLLDLRERLDNVTFGLVSLAKAFDWLPGSVSELAAELLDEARGGEPHADAIWEAPRTAYLLTAAVADGNQAEADALWKSLDKPAQADVLLALAAQLKVNLRTAFSAAGTDAGRYALAGALARMSVDASTAQRIPQNVFAEMCRNTATADTGLPH